MQDQLFSNYWYRVAELKPRVPSNVASHRHYYRGTVWYVVGAKSNKSHLRINASAFYVFSQFNGERTVDEIWHSGLAVLKDDAPSQNEVLQLLAMLFDAALIDFQKQSDVDLLFENYRLKQGQETKSRYWNPLFLRFALFDPDRLAQRLLPLCRWAFTTTAFYAWVAMVVVAVVSAAYTWPSLTAEFGTNLVAPGNLTILWFVFPIMKLLHELGHAVAVKRWGGEVHEFGIALLVLLPVPYVDASDSASFGSKYRRMSVAGAGIVVESTLACIGLLIWLMVEPGLIRDIAFNMLLTGSVSSLLFNGNPLLKFDSYYVLSDMIEIPSLASRSSKYLVYLVKRYVFGVAEKSPVGADGERSWFFCYGILAFCYRLVLTAGICFFVAGQYFFIGVALAIWAVMMQIGLPITRGIKFLISDPSLRHARVRGNALVLASASALAVLLFLAPMPNTTQVRGIVWPIDEAMVRAGADCFVEEVLIENGARVDLGVELVRCDTTQLEAEVIDLRAEQTAARAALFSTRDRVERGLKQSEVDTATELLATAEANLEKTTLVGETSGQFFAPGASNLAGRFFEQGSLIGYVLSADNVAIRTMLSQERVALLGDRLNDVEVRMVRAPDITLPSRVLRRVPAATERLVTPALGAGGGGSLVLHAEDTEGVRLNQAAFELELALPQAYSDSLVGEAVDVRFDHGTNSLAALIYRELRLLFLSKFSV